MIYVGNRVRLKGIKSRTGKVWRTLEDLYRNGAKGKITEIDSESGYQRLYATVQFDGIKPPLQVPEECLTSLS